MSNSVSFKVYLTSQENSQPIEVRRFLIESSPVTSFTYFKQRLENIFPILKGRSFSVLWKDADDDYIDISTDDELIIALTELKENVKIFTVKFSAGSNGNHRSVTCDGCSGPVNGFRYKCLQCPDYDLCSTCEFKKVHLEHFMLRFPNPEEAQIGRRLAHGIARNFRRACNDYNSNHCSFTQEQKSNESRRKCRNFTEPEPKDNAQASSSRPEFGEIPIISLRPEKAEEIIKLFSDGVSGFLHALGLNEMDTDDKEKKDSEQTPQNSQTQTPTPMQQQTEPPSAPMERSRQNTPENNDWTLIDSSIPAAAAQIPMEVSAPKVPEPQPQPQPQQAQATTPLYPTLNSQPDPHNQPSTSSQPPNNSRITGQYNPNSLRFPDIPFNSTPLSLEDRINRTYQALLTMGFNSNGGWLRQLVEYKKGNLDEVLDVLQPHKRS